MRTFSSILPFTNRFGLRRATCMTNGAQGGEGNVSADDMYQRGLECYEKGDYMGATNWLHQAEEASHPDYQGHLKAQLLLGKLFQEGKAVPRNNDAENNKAAEDYYRRAAIHHGSKDGQFCLGELHETQGNYEKAYFWFVIAGMSEHPAAGTAQQRVAAILSSPDICKSQQDDAKVCHAKIQAWCNR